MTQHPTTVAVGLSMTVFEVGIADRDWRLVERRRPNRKQFERFLANQPASHIVMEACGTAASHRAPMSGSSAPLSASSNSVWQSQPAVRSATADSTGMFSSTLPRISDSRLGVAIPGS